MLYFSREKKGLVRSDFSLNLIRLRKEKGLSQRELAALSGLTPRIIAHYETKATKPPVDKAIALAKALEVHVTDLFSKKDDDTPDDLRALITEIDTKTLKKLVLIKNLPPNDRADLYKYLDKLIKLNGLKK